MPFLMLGLPLFLAISEVDPGDPLLVLGVVVLALLGYLKGQAKMYKELKDQLSAVTKALQEQTDAQKDANSLAHSNQEVLKELSLEVKTLTSALIDHLNDDKRHVKVE